MKRDMDVIRAILLAVESRGPTSTYEHFQLEGYDPEVTDYHVGKLAEAGLLKAQFVFGTAPRAIVTELTWQGHEFLDAIRSASVWQRIKNRVTSEGGSIPFEVLKPLAIAYAKESFGLPSGA
ncbi:DUF2513 domain-containing protein [soil metagenome]|jgi:hypothetical protein